MSGRAGREQERVAVGCRPGDGLRADDAARPAPVLDHELLAECLGELVGPGAADEIAGPARSIGQDQLDRPLAASSAACARGLAGDAGDQCRCPPGPRTRDDASALRTFAGRRMPAGMRRLSVLLGEPELLERRLLVGCQRRHHLGIVLGVHVAGRIVVFLVKFLHLRVVVGLLEGVMQLLDDRRVHPLGAREPEGRVRTRRCIRAP